MKPKIIPKGKIKNCLNCGRPLIEIKDEIAGKKTGHLFKCECMKGKIISIG